MVKRDPETGKFVSDDGSVMGQERVLQYNDDIVVQNLPARIGLDSEESGAGQVNNNFRWSVEPAGGLDRNQRAELVALRSSFMGWLRDSRDWTDTGDTEPGYMDITTQIGATDDWHTDEDDGKNPTSMTRSNNNASGDMTLLQGNYVDNDVFWFDRYAYHGPFNDTVNGTGGGTSPVQEESVINYIGDLGLSTGPILDDFDEFGFVMDTQLDNITNLPRLQWNVQAFWNVFEVDEPEYAGIS